MSILRIDALVYRVKLHKHHPNTQALIADWWFSHSSATAMLADAQSPSMADQSSPWTRSNPAKSWSQCPKWGTNWFNVTFKVTANQLRIEQYDSKKNTPLGFAELFSSKKHLLEQNGQIPIFGNQTFRAPNKDPHIISLKNHGAAAELLKDSFRVSGML